MSKEPFFFCAPLSALSSDLWADAFGEDPADVRELIALLSPDATAVLATEGEETIFQGVMIPCLLEGRIGYYLYALTTNRAYRGRGYLARAMAYIREVAEEEGVSFLLLIPADDALAATYRRMGFSVELPLAASRDARRGGLCLPVEKEVPFDGDTERLYAMTARSLPFSAFSAYLASLPEGTAVFYTDDGFRVRAADDPRFLILADETATKKAEFSPLACALLSPLSSFSHFDHAMLADPLPR